MSQEEPDKDDVPSLDQIMSAKGWENRVALARTRREKVLSERGPSTPKARNPLKHDDARSVPSRPKAAAPPGKASRATTKATEPPLVATPPPPKERPRRVGLWAAVAVCCVAIGVAVFYGGQQILPDATVPVAQGPTADPVVPTNAAPTPEPAPTQSAPTRSVEDANPPAPVSNDPAPTILAVVADQTAPSLRVLSAPVPPLPDAAPPHSRSAPLLASGETPGNAPNLISDLTMSLTRQLVPDADLATVSTIDPASGRPALVRLSAASLPDRLPRLPEVSPDLPLLAVAKPVAPQTVSTATTRQSVRPDAGVGQRVAPLLVATSFDGSAGRSITVPPTQVAALRPPTAIEQTPDQQEPASVEAEVASPARAVASTVGTVQPDITPLAGTAPPQRPFRIDLAVRILTPPTTTNGRVVQARDELERFGIADEGILEINYTVSQDHLRYYHDADRARTEDLARAMGLEARDLTSVSTGPSEGRIEYWLAGRAPSPPPAPVVVAPPPVVFSAP